MKEGMKAEPAPLTDEETALRNEKIRVDDFQDKLIHASRKVGKSSAQPCLCFNRTKQSMVGCIQAGARALNSKRIESRSLQASNTLLSAKAPYFMYIHRIHLAGVRFGASIKSLAQ